ncbi:hypothetical protein HYN49_12540 [Flavobacterium pallidum]|uniref:Uncharacterized protein n=1 Tax=Flavobacterium pallidum TaxID=2172098 RepID=A0A2S1SJT2_9FLAO|nr:hypothetical protein HYN49_12540 [Flavobacterium pallidum]
MFAIVTNAQINLNINPTVVEATPKPVVVRYYYLPDYSSYYDVSTKRYIYRTNNRWIRAKYLPGRARNYSYDKCRKIEISDYRGDRPYIYYKKHYAQYAPVVVRRPAVVYVDRKPGKGHGKHHGKGHGKGHGHH